MLGKGFVTMSSIFVLQRVERQVFDYESRTAVMQTVAVARFLTNAYLRDLGIDAMVYA